MQTGDTNDLFKRRQCDESPPLFCGAEPCHNKNNEVLQQVVLTSAEAGWTPGICCPGGRVSYAAMMTQTPGASFHTALLQPTSRPIFTKPWCLCVSVVHHCATRKTWNDLALHCSLHYISEANIVIFIPEGPKRRDPGLNLMHHQVILIHEWAI